MTESKETVTILLEEYDRLLERDEELRALEVCGVDNWGGYSDAMNLLEEDEW